MFSCTVGIIDNLLTMPRKGTKRIARPKIKDADDTLKTRFEDEFDPASQYNKDNGLTKVVVANTTIGSSIIVAWKWFTDAL